MPSYDPANTYHKYQPKDIFTVSDCCGEPVNPDNEDFVCPACQYECKYIDNVEFEEEQRVTAIEEKWERDNDR